MAETFILAELNSLTPVPRRHLFGTLLPVDFFTKEILQIKSCHWVRTVFYFVGAFIGHR